VTAALEAGRPVVALETSIVGQGLPAPHNLRAARGCEAAVREQGAVPATIAVLDGRVRVGLDDGDLQRIASGAIKVSSRDLGPAMVHRAAGATTVAATARAASIAGIRFLATGGIGGVHRGHPEDESADLDEIARSPVAVFCAGAKIVLDLRLTLERLETLGVPVLGYGTDEFPASIPAGAVVRSARASMDPTTPPTCSTPHGRPARVESWSRYLPRRSSRERRRWPGARPKKCVTCPVAR